MTATEAAELSRQLDRARAVLHRADEVFSTWQPDSPISRLRAGEITDAQAPAEVAEVLDRCATARELSGGWFDPWAMPGGVDPTGYVKGWAAQNALAAFSAECIAGAIVNAAGDIASFGGLGNGQPFRIGIADPRRAAPSRRDRRAHRGDRHLGQLRAGQPPDRPASWLPGRAGRLGQRDRP